ncbi:hypothetical protein BN978_01650 [Mycolicibacterium mageritense DSM 44476 = CIP 104973]|uniref:Uncharacterized protein n=1 Tax=Mycolicibacterium mageritense TaxID=53462 RepID=A0AAI8TQP4_MYCME|nr:hypothetical protein hbim_01116 [Mycolicibacterium mageritense]CDO21191.1 hypothetical protein BN978_01650 [Mycolicibacterium mageritense DSM 44476 = CIP 104973]
MVLRDNTMSLAPYCRDRLDEEVGIHLLRSGTDIDARMNRDKRLITIYRVVDVVSNFRRAVLFDSHGGGGGTVNLWCRQSVDCSPCSGVCTFKGDSITTGAGNICLERAIRSHGTDGNLLFLGTIRTERGRLGSRRNVDRLHQCNASWRIDRHKHAYACDIIGVRRLLLVQHTRREPLAVVPRWKIILYIGQTRNILRRCLCRRGNFSIIRHRSSATGQENSHTKDQCNNRASPL